MDSLYDRSAITAKLS